MNQDISFIVQRIPISARFAIGPVLQIARFAGIAFSAAVFLTAAQARSDVIPAPLFADHPLVGSVWTGSGTAIDEADFLKRIADANFVLIGEIHDNPAHHANQAKWLAGIAQMGAKPAVVFEMIPRPMQPTVDEFMRADAPSAEAFGNAIEWEARGWPDWKTYQPILEVAIEHDLPVIAGGVDRNDVMAIGQNGSDALPVQRRSAWGLDSPLPEALRQDLLTELEESHCGMMPKAALTGMIPVQRARDGSLADAMIEGAGVSSKAVMIAGNGHVRKDRGAPYVLASREPDREILSIGQVAVRENANRFANYAAADGSLPYDIVVFTTATPPEDHCAKLREQFMNLKKAPEAD